MIHIGKIENYIDALKVLGDGRYHYWDGKPMGIGCSEYTRLALVKAGIIKDGENFHAASGNPGPLADTTRFQKVTWSPNNLQVGDILWSSGYHVSTWDGVNGVYEAAPESSHGICDNGKTGVGHWSNHTYYNCGTGTYSWTCIYRIVEANGVKKVAKKIETTESENHLTGLNKAEHISILAEHLPVVKHGSTGDIVKALQKILQKYGWYAGEIDGHAGNYTVAGIKLVQTALDVVVDGWCGKETWTHLLK